MIKEDTESKEQILDENEVIEIRKEKLAQLRKGNNPYPNDFRRDSLAQDVIKKFEHLNKEELLELKNEATVAGRIVLRRIMGKASFLHIQDMSGRIQLYVRQNDVADNVYEEFKKWDLGDIIGASGYLFKTNTGELSLHVTQLRLLSKSLRPLPDKFHGLADTELCYRQRYVDLIANDATREVFLKRSRLIQALRQFMLDEHFLEVETPMMHPIPGGALARPFITHHNTLGQDMYLRIAPELYLKRLVVGGFERVFEINRNFRNEGISTQHNPEFTMLEFYQAYADYKDLIELTEKMMRYLAQNILGRMTLEYQGIQYDLSEPFTQLTVKQAILKYNPGITEAELDDENAAKKIAQNLGIECKPGYGLGKIQIEIFEKTAEHQLIQPTFVTQYPTEVSPLARCNDTNPFVTDRFEFFIAGREIANGFSELNDPEDQAQRFLKQVEGKNAGDHEAMHYDEDYIRALEYGLPPTAGEGIGVDRLAMFFTNSPSIRDVILFPQLRGV